MNFIFENLKLIIYGILLAVILLVCVQNWSRIKKFVLEVVVELKKVAWSTRQELVDSTWVVIISSAFLGIFILITDAVLAQLIKLIIR